MATTALTVILNPSINDEKSCVVLETQEWFGIEANPKIARIDWGEEVKVS